MNTQPEALRLANRLDREFADDMLSFDTAQESAAELRRLHEVNQELLKALECVIDDLMYKDHARVIDIARAAIAIATEEQA